MLINLKRMATLLMLLPLMLAGCRSAPPAEAEPTPIPDMVLTAAAETAGARLTELAQPTDTQPPPPTDTPLPATPTQAATETPIATPTLAGEANPTATTGAVSGQDRAEYVADITVEDGTDFNPGDSFDKVWRLKNAGLSTWTTGYALAFISGAQMGAPVSVALTRNVPPGEMIDVSVRMTAPLETGTHRGYWKMKNSAGELFDGAVYVEIDVLGGTPPAVTTTPSSSTARVTDVSLTVSEATPAACPHTFNFSASFTLNEPAAVTYRLEASTTTPGFTFDLQGPITASFEAGTHTVTYNLTINDPVTATAQLHVLAPNDVISNQVAFSCP